MQTKLSADIANTPDGKVAEAILRSCVHCGFCTATCPTYQLLGDERDGPRGRIYLIKQVLEGQIPTRETQLHLDRCLSCRACETTCPSGVKYARLADIGREQVEQQVKRPWSERLIRSALRHTVPYPQRMSLLIQAGTLFKPLLPETVKSKLPSFEKVSPQKRLSHQRKMLALAGCVQSVSDPQTNQSTAAVLNQLGIELIEAREAGCCGAVSHHLSASQQALTFIRKNIDAWWPYIEAGAEAIVMTASGCGSMVKEYGYLLRNDPAYADKARHISELCKDIVEIIAAQNLEIWHGIGKGQTIAFQSPCSLQHGQQLGGQVEQILTKLGFTLTPVRDAHLCCGSAGTYSLLQEKLSKQLKINKLKALKEGNPERIVTANIGCQMHLTDDDNPINHWIELLAEKIKNG